MNWGADLPASERVASELALGGLVDDLKKPAPSVVGVAQRVDDKNPDALLGCHLDPFDVVARVIRRRHFGMQEVELVCILLGASVLGVDQADRPIERLGHPERREGLAVAGWPREREPKPGPFFGRFLEKAHFVWSPRNLMNASRSICQDHRLLMTRFFAEGTRPRPSHP